MVKSSQSDYNVRFSASFFHVLYKRRKAKEDVERGHGCGSACTGPYEEDPRLHLFGGVNLRYHQPEPQVGNLPFRSPAVTARLSGACPGPPPCCLKSWGLWEKGNNESRFIPRYHVLNSQLWNQLRLPGPWCRRNNQNANSAHNHKPTVAERVLRIFTFKVCDPV